MAQGPLHALWLLSALFYSAVAHNTTDPIVSLLLIPIAEAGFDASVITAQPSATLFAVDCTTVATSPIPTNACSNIHNITVLQGPATFTAEFSIIEESATV
jgi:hypothetical protein